METLDFEGPKDEKFELLQLDNKLVAAKYLLSKISQVLVRILNEHKF